MAFKIIFGRKIMGRGKDCSPEEKRLIVNLWNGGRKLTKIAEISNCFRKIIYNVIISFNANIIMSQKTKKKSRVMKTTEFVNDATRVAFYILELENKNKY